MSLTIAIDETTGNIPIIITNDSGLELDETVVIELSRRAVADKLGTYILSEILLELTIF